MTDPSFAARIQRLEDIEAIRRLKSLYSHYANVGEGSGDPEKFAALFTEDCEWDLSNNPLHGRQAIIDRLHEIERLHYIGLHFALNPRIDVNGDEAYGEWDLIFPVYPPDGAPMTTVCGFYWDRFRRTEDGWKFTCVKYRVSEKFATKPV